MAWTNPSSEPNSDEKVVRDAHRTIERVVEAARSVLEGEFANHRAEYADKGQPGLASGLFAMYQSLVMTFFEDHKMSSSLKLKISRGEISDSQRAFLNDLISQRVNTATGEFPTPTAWGQEAGAGTPNVWSQTAEPANPQPTVSSGAWSQAPQPVQPAANATGDWLKEPTSASRPSSAAWPGQEEEQSGTWTLKPGTGGPAPAANHATPQSNSPQNSWSTGAAKSGSWPEQPASTWPASNNGNTSKTPDSAWPTQPTWPQEPTANTANPHSTDAWTQPEAQTEAGKELPKAAWTQNETRPAGWQGDGPVQTLVPQINNRGVVKPAWNAPIGESGQSGTWTIDDRRPNAQAVNQPPQPAQTPTANQAPVGQTPPGFWEAPPDSILGEPTPVSQVQSVSQQAPGQPQQLGSWPAPGNQLPPPAWSSQPKPQPASASETAWNPPSNSPQAAWSPEQPAQSAPAAAPAANNVQPWSSQNQVQSNQQNWNSPPSNVSAPLPAWSPNAQRSPEPAPPVQQPVTPPANMPPATAAWSQQPANTPQSAWSAPPTNAVANPNQAWNPQPTDGAAPPAAWSSTNNGGAQPWSQQQQPTNSAPPQPVQQQPYQQQNQQQIYQQQQAPQPVQQSREPDDWVPEYPNPWGEDPPSNGAQQANSWDSPFPADHIGLSRPAAPPVEPPPQRPLPAGNANQDTRPAQGGGLSGVLSQMRNFDQTRRRGDDDEKKDKVYDPTNAW